MPHRCAPTSSLRALRQAALALLLGALVGSCFKPPPPPPPPAPTGPVIPTQVIPKAQYVKSWVDFEIREIFVGAPMYRSALHWMVAGHIRNRGNQTLDRVEVRFHFAETGHREDVVVLDAFQEQTPLKPGESRDLLAPTARLEYGVEGNIDPAKVNDVPPPTVTAQVLALKFKGEE